jgi:hypothetical protein
MAAKKGWLYISLTGIQELGNTEYAQRYDPRKCSSKKICQSNAYFSELQNIFSFKLFIKYDSFT